MIENEKEKITTEIIERKDLIEELPTTKKNQESFWGLLKTILFFIGLFFIIRSFVFIPFVVWGTSMKPTLNHRDYLIVDRSPRFRIPQPGEIIIFINPHNPREKLVKRISHKKFENNQFKFWVLGDNKGYSIDSRNFGYVNEKYIVGRVFLRIWPNFTSNFQK
jgi:signal peptidase I